MTRYAHVSFDRTSTRDEGGLVAFLKSGLQRYLQHRRLRNTVFSLQALDDRTLHDIGLDRSEIESVVNARGAERRHRVNIMA